MKKQTKTSPRRQTKIEPQEIVVPNKPAVVLTIQSWATPIVGVAMLVIGLLTGYYLRPLTLAQAANEPAEAVVTPPAVIATANLSVLPTPNPSATQGALMESVLAKTRHFRGDADAPVTMIEFGDFQCPFCGRFFAQTKPQLEENYIQAGKVQFGYFNFAFLGPESTWAAEAAECASDQDKFWEYHDKLYGSQSGENQGAFNKEILKKFAEELGLDTSTFNDCLDFGKYTQLVQDDSNTARSIGVRSTPTFLINSQSVVGALPFERFQQTIDALLN